MLQALNFGYIWKARRTLNSAYLADMYICSCWKVKEPLLLLFLHYNISGAQSVIWHLRSSAYGEFVVPSHRTDRGMRSLAVASPTSWNVLPVELRSFFFNLDTLAKRLNNTFVSYTRRGVQLRVCIKFCEMQHDNSVTRPWKICNSI